jgi:DNA-binding NtrC family response regulator/tetratricopeptide (TPR) repeat protein
MTYDDAVKLFRKGHFRELINGFKESGRWRDIDPNSRVLFAYVLALCGQTSFATSVIRIEDQKANPRLRSQIDATLGTISWWSGDQESASKHLHCAIQGACESKNLEWIAWTHLHLFRFAVDARPAHAFDVMLPDVRKAVIRAGIPSLTAYLHNCVATLEGYRGHVDEASRHCDIADSLLETDPNAWILAGILMNRGCLATVRCEFREAAEYYRAVVGLTEITGSLRTCALAESNAAYLQLITGELGKAEETLKRALSNASKSGTTTFGALDILARVYLAAGELDKCEETLESVNSGQPVQYSMYETRWAALTKAKLLLKRGEFDVALTWLEALEAQSRPLDDQPFNAAVHLLAAQTLNRIGKRQECARRVVKADLAGIRHSVDLQGQFHHSIGVIVANDDTGLASQMQERAKRIWSTQGIVSVRSEIDDAAYSRDEPKGADAGLTTTQDVKAAINCIAAAFEVAYNPKLLGAELLNVLEMSGCSSHANVLETSDMSQHGLDSGGRRMILRLGDAARSGKSLTLACDAPSSPSDAVVLTDVFRIGRATIALERARQEERGRAALWPSDPIEDRVGALFIAEEMHVLLDSARRVAAANIPVLITGETGTGKEVLARLIHNYSPRAAKTFLPFNCSATPREMLDAQLFGHRKGAFTGASENFSGVIRAAAGGTLFLDEIGESTLDIQPKLLRFLESGEVHPIGETHPQRVDVRVLAATNADVDTLVAQGRFREDLFYRLNIVRLHIPPLRERRVEIPAFANHYLQKYAKEMSKGELRLSEETMEYLVLYRWPGNVRQIANEMRRLAALAESGAVLMPEHLSSDIATSRRTVPVSDRTLDPSEIVVRVDQPLSAAVQHLERAMVQAALAKTSGVDEAAKRLGVSRKGLYLKRLRFGMEIDRPKSDSEVA